MANGGIIGPINVTSRGKNTITSKTSSGNICTQSGTRLVQTLVVAGGGGGGVTGAGGGAGGFRTSCSISVCLFSKYIVRIITKIAPNEELITDLAMPSGTKDINGSKPK